MKMVLLNVTWNDSIFYVYDDAMSQKLKTMKMTLIYVFDEEEIYFWRMTFYVYAYGYEQNVSNDVFRHSNLMKNHGDAKSARIAYVVRVFVKGLLLVFYSKEKKARK